VADAGNVPNTERVDSPFLKANELWLRIACAGFNSDSARIAALPRLSCGMMMDRLCGSLLTEPAYTQVKRAAVPQRLLLAAT
jgi:hypothetical protein